METSTCCIFHHIHVTIENARFPLLYLPHKLNCNSPHLRSAVRAIAAAACVNLNMVNFQLSKSDIIRLSVTIGEILRVIERNVSDMLVLFWRRIDIDMDSYFISNVLWIWIYWNVKACIVDKPSCLSQ